jgi:PAS domain S-box-containing protein
MKSAAAAPVGEVERLRALERFHILDTEPEERFDRVARLAARLFRTPIALVTFIDGHRQWHKARLGTEFDEVPREIAFCNHTIRGDDTIVVTDTRSDARFAENPIVRQGIRFYAGAPLVTRDGQRIGTVCVLDREPRPDLGAADGEQLALLAAMVVDELELRVIERQLSLELASRMLAEERLKLQSDLTEAASAAHDFKAAMRACLTLVAEHVGADGAVVYGLAPDAALLQPAAQYAVDTDARRFLDLLRSRVADGDDSPAGDSVREQRLIAIPDLGSGEHRRAPLARVAAERGFRAWLGIPFENGGAKLSLTFLFRRPPRDMPRLADTVSGLSGKLRDLLARKQAEERIALLQSVVLHATDAIMIMEMAGGNGGPPPIVYVNRAFSAMTGYAIENVLGATPELLFGPRTSAQAIERLQAALAGTEPVRIELINYRRDGSHFWAEADLVPMSDASGGTHTHWLLILRDTTARKHAEEQLRERELTLRQLALQQAAILDALPAHVAVLDRDGRILSVSRSWQDFAAAAGITSGATVGDSYFAFCSADCWGGAGRVIADGLSAVLAGRQTQFSIDHPCDQRGWRRWYRLMAAPLSTGQSAGAVVMHLDVTASKLAEEALRREKEFSEFLIKSSSEGIVVFDRDFSITLWNPGIERVTGMGVEEVLGRRIFEVLPDLVETAGEAAMRAALEGRETSLYDQRYAVPGTGRAGYYDAFFSPLYSRGREVIGGIGFLRETTERRRIEDALRQSQKMEAVGQLTGGIAHDFNNMLTVIAGNLELLEGKLVGEQRLLRLVSSAALAASRAEKLTQQLLTFSRRQQLRPQPIDFNQIIIGMDDLLHRTVGEHIEIRAQLAADLWPALADPNQIETALLNLILNARDAMATGGHITIETGNVEFAAGQGEIAAGAYATLAVTDNGQGMSEEVLAHVFEPFFTTKEVGKGTGLGLSQVYGFVKQSTGHVKIESNPASGTTVRLYLPRAPGSAGLVGATPTGERQYRGNECVLVVEDDHGVRDFAVSVLREFGYRVVEAANGDAALELLATTPDVDLLFTDVVMPGKLTGADLAKVALKQRPSLRLLFTSGYTTRLVEKEWPENTVDLLRKPYRSVDLAARIRAVLDRAAAE